MLNLDDTAGEPSAEFQSNLSYITPVAPFTNMV